MSDFRRSFVIRLTLRSDAGTGAKIWTSCGPAAQVRDEAESTARTYRRAGYEVLAIQIEEAE